MENEEIEYMQDDKDKLTQAIRILAVMCAGVFVAYLLILIVVILEYWVL